MNESQWRLFCIVFLGSLCVAMVWAELSRASTAPVGTHWSVFRHEMIHEDLRQEDPVFSGPLGGKQDVRMLGGPLIDRVLLMRASVPELEIPDRAVPKLLMYDSSAYWMTLGRLYEVVPGVMRNSFRAKTRPRLVTENVDAIGPVEKSLVQSGAMEQIFESVRKHDVSVKMNDPIETLEMAEPEINSASLIKGCPVRVHLCRLNTVDTVAIADALRFPIIGVAHDDNVIEIGKIFRETVGQKIRVVFTHNNGFKFHDEIL